jgi:hypothetical protein
MPAGAAGRGTKMQEGHEHSFVPTRYEPSLLRILTLRESKAVEETCKYCGEKREPQPGK